MDRTRWRLAGSLAAVALLVAAMLEVGLRLEALQHNARQDRRIAALGLGRSPAPGSRVDLGQMLRASADPRIVYELIPNLSVRWMQPIRINGAGFRGPEVSIGKPPGTARIVGLGDSVMFGFGVRNREPFMASLEQKLNQRHPRVRWEAINTAVPGYNAAMEIQTLRAKGLRYRPDLVIVNWVGDDFDLPGLLDNRGDPLARHSLLVQRAVEWLRRWKIDAALAHAGWIDPVARDPGPDHVPGDLTHLAGWSTYVGDMRDLAAMGEEHGFRTVVLAHPDLDPRVRALATQLGFVVLETRRSITRYAKRHGIQENDARLVLSKADGHPTALAHGLIADALLETLEKRGIVNDIVNRVSAGAPAEPAS